MQLEFRTKRWCMHQIQDVQSKERCMANFRSLQSHLQVFLQRSLKGTRIEHGYKAGIHVTLVQSLIISQEQCSSNVDQLQKQLDKDEFQEDDPWQPFGWSGMIQTADDADTNPYMTKKPNGRGRVDQYPETCQVKSHMPDSSPDNQTTEYSKQSLESENILLKKTVAQFQKDFSRMEAHCIALELKYQNQSLKSGQHGQILKETSNKAKIEKEIDVLETMNIELEHSVATLRKENETLKQHYKDLYDSIKITRSKTTEQTTSLLANNAKLKAQIQEKVFAIAALKNDLRKLKGNSVDTKFDKTSVLGKPCTNTKKPIICRQPNAFKSERAQMSKQRFALPRF
ncbi:hypothetical protein Tco_1302865 [Tanacetum coccineum]